MGTVKLTCPDSYRLGLSPADTTEKCVAEFLRLLDSRNEKPAAFIVESLICCGGQVVLPPNYLKRMHAVIRERGGLAIADEVQAGFGRVGDHMWAFESQVPSLQKYTILRAEELRGRGQCQI
jgi:4-aminobutyrate aminotransferase-like enzyme